MLFSETPPGTSAEPAGGNPHPAVITDKAGPKITRIALIAGSGKLPVHVARNAAREGIEVIPFVIDNSNTGDLKKLCWCPPVKIIPGLLNQNLALLRKAQIEHIVFAGKVNKWLLLKEPRLDPRALAFLKSAIRLADDDVMMGVVNELAKEGLNVLPQTRFLQNLFVPQGCLTHRKPDERDELDIHYGYQMAKEMGRLDIGQSIVVSNGMILAVEAIEGTDECLKRGGKYAKNKGGTVVKVAKPNQDQRFDVPTVGLSTLKTMKNEGLHCLATEANQTLFIDLEEMIPFANQHNMIITSVLPSVSVENSP